MDYIERARRISLEGGPAPDFDVDDDNNVFYKPRDIAAGEGIQEALAETPQLVYDAYMYGHAMRVGIARYWRGRAPTELQIRAGHRNQTKMKLLQTVEVYGGL